jgi:hypothetical protein
MHTLAGTASTFFTPTFATSLWLATFNKVLPKSFHTVAILYSFKVSSG